MFKKIYAAGRGEVSCLGMKYFSIYGQIDYMSKTESWRLRQRITRTRGGMIASCYSKRIASDTTTWQNTLFD